MSKLSTALTEYRFSDAYVLSHFYNVFFCRDGDTEIVLCRTDSWSVMGYIDSFENYYTEQKKRTWFRKV
jgi:hypothetical protein